MSTSFEQTKFCSCTAFSLFPSKRLSKILFCIVLMLICLIPVCFCSTCSAPSTSTNKITSEECIISGSTQTATYKIVSGPVSNSLYFSYSLTNPIKGIIRKINTDGSLAWMAAFSRGPILKSLSVDVLEQYVYFSFYYATFTVIRLSTSTGAIVGAESFSYIDGRIFDYKVHIRSDGTGYYALGTIPGNANTIICKYLFSTPASCDCQSYPNIRNEPQGQLMLSDSTFFILGSTPTTPFDLHFYKHTFGNTSPDWAQKSACVGGGCVTAESESILVSSSIYTFFTYGGSTRLYMAELSLSDGSASKFYKESSTCGRVYGIAVTGDYIVVCTQCITAEILTYNKATNVFTIKKFAGTRLYGVNLEPITGRIVLSGWKDPNGYTSSFYLQDLTSHPDFQISATWTMNSMLPGVQDITPDASQTIDAVVTNSVGFPTYTNQTVTYTQGTVYNSDITYFISSQTFIYAKNAYVQVLPDLTCSNLGSTAITYSLSSYNSNIVPTWVTISSSTGQLTLTTPSPLVNTDYPFYISSTISGFPNAVNKLITISVYSCTDSNCQTCQNDNISICITCNSGYTINSSTCAVINTPTASASTNNPTSASTNNPTTSASTNKSTNKSSSINDNEFLKSVARICELVNNIVLATISTLVLISNVSFSTSMLKIWLMINKVQLFFLLLLTRAFIPDQIKEIITDQSFLLNPFDTFPCFNPHFYGDLLGDFKIDIDNPKLKDFKIDSSSTIYNSFSIIEGTICMVILHILVYFIHKRYLNRNIEGRCAKLIRLFLYICKRTFEIMTFAFYIRNILEMSQFFMISCINEIYSFNFSGIYRIISTSFALFVFIFFITIIILLVLFALSSYKELEGEHNRLGEIFIGLKSNKKGRIYVAITMIRKIIFISILLTFSFISSRTAIGILIALQIFYMSYLVIARPCREIDSTLIEFGNECTFLLLLILFIFFNSENDWIPLKVLIGSILISTNSVFSSVIIIFFFCYSICKCLKQRKLRRIQTNQSITVNQSSSMDLMRRIKLELSNRKMQNNVQAEVAKREIEESKENIQIQNINDSLYVDNRFHIVDWTKLNQRKKFNR